MKVWKTENMTKKEVDMLTVYLHVLGVHCMWINVFGMVLGFLLKSIPLVLVFVFASIVYYEVCSKDFGKKMQARLEEEE